MKYAVCAWLEFIIGLILLCSYDYYVHWRDSWLVDGRSQLHDVIWFGTPLLLGVIALPLLWHSTATFSRFWARIAAVAIHIIIGFMVYVFAILWYALELSIQGL